MVQEGLCSHHDAVYTYNWGMKNSKHKNPGQEEASAQKAAAAAGKKDNENSVSS